MTVIQAFGLNEGDEVPNEVVEPKVITPRKNGSDSSIHCIFMHLFWFSKMVLD